MKKLRCGHAVVLVFASFSLFLAGCDTSMNVSKNYPFNEYVGKTVELQRPAAVVNRVNGWFSIKGVISMRHARYGLINGPPDEQCRGYYGPVLAVLPAGHKIKIDSVRFEVMAGGDRDQITAYGHTTIPPSIKEVSFAAPWGGDYANLVLRTPWEPENTLARKFHVGFWSFTVETNNLSLETNQP
jgi:hypothetical protein